jgi:hypothetical protein
MSSRASMSDARAACDATVAAIDVFLGAAIGLLQPIFVAEGAGSLPLRLEGRRRVALALGPGALVFGTCGRCPWMLTMGVMPLSCFCFPAVHLAGYSNASWINRYVCKSPSCIHFDSHEFISPNAHL